MDRNCANDSGSPHDPGGIRCHGNWPLVETARRSRRGCTVERVPDDRPWQGRRQFHCKHLGEEPMIATEANRVFTATGPRTIGCPRRRNLEIAEATVDSLTIGDTGELPWKFQFTF